MALQMLLSFLFTLLMFGVAGVAVAWALLKGLKPRMVLGAGMLALALYMACNFILGLSTAGGKEELFSSLQQSVDQVWTVESKAMQDAKIPQDEIDQEKIFYSKYSVWCIPAYLAIFCLIIGLLAYYIVSSLLSRVTTRVSHPIPFRDWVVPDYLVFGLIIGGVIKVIPFHNQWVEAAGNNLLVFFLALYAFEGLSLLSFFFFRFRLSVALRVLTYLVILSYLRYLEVFLTISAIGVLDVWFNFRKLKTPPLETNP